MANTITADAVNKKSTNGSDDTPSPPVINMDVAAWNAAADKLSLKEAGELVRSLLRAQGAHRPNREQRILLAIFTRDPDEEVAS